MATGVIYLDIDDELTSAASRIRDVQGGRVAVVLPYGSRVATSRINFRLLARDAGTHGKRLSIISADAATRSLAASAGLAVFASVVEYEGSLEPGAAEDPDLAPSETARVPVAPSRRRGTAKVHVDAPEQATLDEIEAFELAKAANTLERERAAVPERRRVVLEPRPATISPPASPPVRESRAATRRTPLVIAAAVIALAVLVTGVGAYLLLPSARIVVTPRAVAVPPVVMTIVADPAASAPDPVKGVVPAEVVTVEVVVSDTFVATGKRVEATKATAIVRFRNLDITSSNTIPAGSVVSTNNGIRFVTDAAITVPRATRVGLQIFPRTAMVAVTAVKGGPEGNVEPNTIIVIPKGEDPVALVINNPDEGVGGTRTEFPKIVQEDLDAALLALQPALMSAFQARLADPSIASPGATVFAETGVLGTAAPSVDPATLLDLELADFQLGLSATGTVTAVDAAPVAEVAAQRLTSTIDADHRLVEGSIEVDVDPAIVTGGQVTFPATATATQVPILDPVRLKASVLGLSLDDARTALEAFGLVELSAWPGWVSSIPTIDGRVELTIDGGVVIETAAPSASP